MQYNRIVTHAGNAHRDDFLSCCIAMARYSIKTIERREPTEDELNDPSCLVLDVGNRYEPDKGNFDHHQRGRNDTPECALSLFLRAEGIEKVFKLAKWYRPSILLDATGPFATAKALELSRFPFELSSPIENVMLKMFEGYYYLGHGNFATMMFMMGSNILDDVETFAGKVEALYFVSNVIEVKGIKVIRFTTDDSDGTQEVRDMYYPDAMASIMYDNRGSGLTLYRFDDCPKIDFSMLEGHDAISFAHKGGFIAKTKELLDMGKVIELLELAIK